MNINIGVINNMDLTNKINSYDISIGRCDNPMNDYHFASGVDYTLVEITPKVAIDFSAWLSNNRWFIINNGKYHQTLEHPAMMSDNTYNKNHVKTPEELFQEFLKDYIY